MLASFRVAYQLRLSSYKRKLMEDAFRESSGQTDLGVRYRWREAVGRIFPTLIRAQQGFVVDKRGLVWDNSSQEAN